MAIIEPPKKTAGQGASKPLAAVKAPTGAAEQIPPDSIAPLQLKIPATRKNEFKAYAAIRGRSMANLFLEMFEEHKEKHA